MTSEKLCVFCTKFFLSTGYDDTFNSKSGSMSCDAGHFWFGGMNGCSENDLRTNINMAKTCKDYNQVKV